MAASLRGDSLLQELQILGSSTPAGSFLRARDSYYVMFTSAQSAVQVREVLLWYNDYAVVAGTVEDDFTSIGPANPDGNCFICVPFMDISMLLSSIEYRKMLKFG